MSNIHYSLETRSYSGELINLLVTYDVYYDSDKGISYEAELLAPPDETSQELVTVWRTKIFNDIGGKRLEYDYLQRIYYQTNQTIEVEKALYNLREDVSRFLDSDKLQPVADQTLGGKSYPGYNLYTLTIWYDPDTYLPVKRINQARGGIIVDEFTYYSEDQPLPPEVFELPKPPEAIADFDLYPEAPGLPRFEEVKDADDPEYGVYVYTLLEDIKRHLILNQWEYGPFSTIKLPWLTEMTASIYRAQREEIDPPIIVTFDVPNKGRAYFFVAYDFLGYVVVGYSDTDQDLSDYTKLPLTRKVKLKDLVPLYAEPSDEKRSIIYNYLTSLRSMDFFITAFDMGDKYFDLIIKNFNFHENEGYYLLNVYGKEFWDSLNIEAMFNYVIGEPLTDSHILPLLVYKNNTIKRLGIYKRVQMPDYKEIPAGEEAPPEEEIIGYFR